MTCGLPFVVLGPGRRLAEVAGWLVAGSVAALAAARLARLDESTDLLLLAGGLTPFLWLPALAALGVGLALARRALAAVAGAVAVVYLAWALPGLGFPESVPAGQGAELRLFSANLHYQNADTGPIAAEIGTADPDVVALQELSPSSGAGLRRAGVLDATRWHRGLGRLLADGLTDAHERRGRGWVPTWPAGRRLLPPLLRLHHVLVSPEVAVRAVREGTGSGSDHRPLVADLVLG